MRGMRRLGRLSLRAESAAAPHPYEDFLYAVDNVNSLFVFEQTPYASLALMPGYTASPLSTNDPTLTDIDMLIIAQVVTGTLGAHQFIWNITNPAGDTRILFWQTGSDVLQVNVTVAGAVALSDATNATITAGRTISIVLRRLSGAWSVRFIEAGAALLRAGSAGDNTFPSSALMTKSMLGEHTDGTLDFTGTRRGHFIIPGTFANDAAIIAALPLP